MARGSPAPRAMTSKAQRVPKVRFGSARLDVDVLESLFSVFDYVFMLFHMRKSSFVGLKSRCTWFFLVSGSSV